MIKTPNFLRRPGARVAGEMAFVAALAVTWIVAYVSIDRSLDDLSPAGRAFYLGNYFTAESLSLAFWLVLGLCALLPLRHIKPLVTLALVSALVTFVQWRYPLYGQNGIVLRLALGVCTFWAIWRIKNWWLAVPFVIPAILVTGWRSFQIDDRFEALNSAPGSAFVSLSTVVQEALLYAGAIGAGLIARRLVGQSAELAQRNLELEQERAITAETAVIDERLRISRELHDVVAHHVTTMTVHAGAARQMIHTAPDKAEDSLRHIETAGRNAVNELHQMLGFLRDSGQPSDSAPEGRAPTPSLRHLEALRTQFGSNLSCDINVDGDIAKIPAAVDLSAYRIVQEALTNAMKHSSATTAAIDIVVGKDAVQLEIIDKGSAAPSTPTKSGGHGIVGMKERASLHGGTVEVGPMSANGSGSANGWRVHALLPFGAQR